MMNNSSMDNISFNELTEMIKQYSEGSKKQDNPQIVWIDDNLEGIVKYQDVYGFAKAMGSATSEDSKQSFFSSLDQPSPWLNYCLDIEGNRYKVDKNRMPYYCHPCIPINTDEYGNVKTRLFIHSTLVVTKGEWMSIEAGLMIFKKFDIPVLMLYPLSFMNHIKDNLDISEYDELYCSASTEY